MRRQGVREEGKTREVGRRAISDDKKTLGVSLE
jgi:hypothetical protein